jgi:Beta-propeller repeat
LVVTGYTLSTNFPITALTAVQSTNNGNGDAWVALVDPTQPAADFILYSTFLGGSDGDVGYGVTSDSAGFLYVTGYTLSSNFPVTSNAPQPNWGGGVNMFVSRINPAIAGLEALDYSTYIGLDNTIVGCCLAIAPNGSLVIGGYTEGYLPLLPTYTPLQSIYGGGFSDDFLLVLSPPSSTVMPAQTPETRTLPRKERPRPGVLSPVIR